MSRDFAAHPLDSMKGDVKISSEELRDENNDDYTFFLRARLC